MDGPEALAPGLRQRIRAHGFGLQARRFAWRRVCRSGRVARPRAVEFARGTHQLEEVLEALFALLPLEAQTIRVPGLRDHALDGFGGSVIRRHARAQFLDQRLERRDL